MPTLPDNFDTLNTTPVVPQVPQMQQPVQPLPYEHFPAAPTPTIQLMAEAYSPQPSPSPNSQPSSNSQPLAMDPSTHGFASFSEVQQFLPDMVKDHHNGVRVRSLMDSLKFTINGPIGKAEVYVFLQPNTGYPQTSVSYSPPMAVNQMQPAALELQRWLDEQLLHLANYLRTGNISPQLRIRQRRGPGRPAASQVMDNPAGIAQQPMSEPTPGYTAGYDLVFQPITTDPYKHAVYSITPFSRKGQARIQYEQELNYPKTYHSDELRAALFFYETRGLRCLVADATPNPLTGERVVKELNQVTTIEPNWTAYEPPQTVL